MNSLLLRAFGKRRPLYKATDAVRLVNSQGDGLDGLILEQYDRHFCAQVLSKDWLKQIYGLLECVSKQFKPRYFIVKDRTGSSAAAPEAIKTQVLLDEGAGPRTIVREHNASFLVDLNDGLNSGLFLDMRANRLKIAQQAAGKRMLNCFAYTCSFGVHARLHKASEVVNVDVSAKVLERGRRNYELNQITPGPLEFVRADALGYVERAIKRENFFDMIVIDPPSFARSAEGVFQAKTHLLPLLKNAVRVLNRGGTLFVSSNFSGFKTGDIKNMVVQAAAPRKISGAVTVYQDVDFPGTNTFKESCLTGLWCSIV